MTTPGRCHPSVSRPAAPLSRSIRVNRGDSPFGPPGALEDRIQGLNRERPPLLMLRTPGVAPGST
jgi:hypothetical protein